jgi:starch-binding outer membrane protein, SusD/RagB family
MKTAIRNGAAVLLLAFGSAACLDLNVANPNDPDRSLALQRGSDIEALIAGAFSQWYLGTNAVTDAPGLALSNAAFQHSSMAANFAQLQYGAIPRVPLQNDPVDPDWNNIAGPWYRNYRALAAVAEGLRALERPEMQAELGAARVLRARAYGRFVQGLAHSSIALLYDRGFVIDENVAVFDEQGNLLPFGEPVSYNDVMAAALEFFDDAIALAGQGSFTIPEEWTTLPISSGQLVRISHSLKARYRAAVARDPQERQAVDWAAVLQDVQNGLNYASGETWLLDHWYVHDNWEFWEPNIVYGSLTGLWQQANYMILGMADQSGRYQQWLQQPVSQRQPMLPGEVPFLISTPDLRFPQGATPEAQSANPGRYWWVGSPSGQWARPDRGTWRWSWYWNNRWYFVFWFGDPVPEILPAEMRLLAAEAHYWRGNPELAAPLINVTRTQNGLNATNAAGANSSCVPQLPSGACGGLLEMLKWEKRLEVYLVGLMNAPWYFDSRGWGDLYRGTPLQFPIPANDVIVLGIDGGVPYTFGGIGGNFASTGSSYAWPFE